jgi:DNA-directed RNA polymerase specialized sigma24 family protein
MIDLDTFLPAIVARDAEAFAGWLAGAERPLRLSLRRFAPAVDTEAVLQECLLRVWVVAARCEADGRPNSLLRFAGRIARNLALDEIRRQRGVAATGHGARGEGGREGGGRDNDAADPEPADPTPPADPLLRRRVEECLGKLPRAPRRAIDLRVGAAGGEDDAHLAARLGMRLNTFLQNVTRARRLVAQCLEKSGIAVTA